MQRLTMFIAVAMLMAYAVSAAAATYQQFPTDDIWVYNNAVDPTGEPTLYAWGHSGYSIDPLGYPFSTDTVWEGEISYSYVKWNTSSIPAGAYNVTSASLTVKTRYPNYTKALGQAHPLEAHALPAYFSEATWDYDDPNNQNPGVLFGNGDLSAYSATQIFAIPINLLANEATLGRSTFNGHFNKAVNSSSGSIALAFASTLDVGDQNFGAGGNIYQFYSRDAGDGTYGPNLQVTYQAIPPSKTSATKVTTAVGTRVYLKNVIVTAVFSGAKTLFVEEQDRSSAIGVRTDESLTGIVPGQVVSIIGKTAIWNNAELGIEGENVIRGTVGTPLNPVALVHRFAGGGQFGHQPAITGAYGVNSVGLLIRTTGHVTGSKASFASPFDSSTGAFWIDDGSGLADGYTTDGSTASQGLTVIRNGGAIPSGNVVITGILRATNGPNGATRILVPLSIQSLT